MFGIVIAGIIGQYIAKTGGSNTGRKNRFEQLYNWSKYDANLGFQIWPKYALEAMIM